MSDREMVVQKIAGFGVDAEVMIPYEVLVKQALPYMVAQRPYEVITNVVFDHENQEVRFSIRPKDLHAK